jgi:isopenicillin N synthase-like dioxygenase
MHLIPLDLWRSRAMVCLNIYKLSLSRVETFFKSADEVKKPYEIEGISGQRGYVGKGKETAKGFKVPDLKEFYHVGQAF